MGVSQLGPFSRALASLLSLILHMQINHRVNPPCLTGFLTAAHSSTAALSPAPIRFTMSKTGPPRATCCLPAKSRHCWQLECHGDSILPLLMRSCTMALSLLPGQHSKIFLLFPQAP